MQNIIKIMDREDKEDNKRKVGVTRMGIFVLQFIRQYVEKHEIPPTHREIFDFLQTKGYGRNANAFDFAVKKLIASGKIEKRGATRNLWPVENKE